jgi:hypothetical protein
VAPGRESPGDGPTDAGAGPGHDCDPVAAHRRW